MTEPVTALQAAKLVPPKTIDKIYDDLLREPLREIGQAAVDIVQMGRLVMLPVHVLAVYGVQLRASIDRLAERIPPDHRDSGDPQIVKEILERLISAIDEVELWKACEELLAKHLDRDSRHDKTQKIFVSVLRQLSGDEILLLKELLEADRYLTETRSYGLIELVGAHHPGTFAIEKSIIHHAKSLLKKQTHAEFQISMMSDEKAFSIWRDHLISMGIISIHPPEIEPTYRYFIFRTGQSEATRFSLTDFGRRFIEACVPPVQAPPV